MPWLAITLQADSRVADAIADALIEAGALSVSCDDADAGTPRETAQFAEPGTEPAHGWRHNVLTALVEADAQPELLVEAASRACGIAAPSFSVANVADQDWVRSTQAQFEPLAVAPGLWIVPSWCVAPDPGAINLEIDPGLAFGTGSHPTTRLILRWLTSTLSGGETLLDYGCGSGILAIAAAKLGATQVSGVDIDRQALLAAQDNARKNHVAAEFFLPDEAPARQYDIVVANILANPIVEMADLLTACSRDRIALSGILETQCVEVAAAYSPAFILDTTSSEEGWVLITGRRR